MRGCLLPLTLMQLSKSAELARLAPQCEEHLLVSNRRRPCSSCRHPYIPSLSPPVPLPFPAKGSGVTIGRAWREYGKRRREVGAPGFVWFVAPTLVHVRRIQTYIHTRMCPHTHTYTYSHAYSHAYSYLNPCECLVYTFTHCMYDCVLMNG